MRIGRLCQQSGMNAEANEWFELAYQRNPRRRPPGFDQARLAPVDDGPTVALSRPVLKESVLSQPADYSPGMVPRTDSGSGSRILLCERESDFNTTQGPRHGSSSGTPMGGGVALFDFDDDGWLDIYFVNGCALPFDRAVTASAKQAVSQSW